MKLPAELVKLGRKAKRAKQNDLAEFFGVSKQAVVRWEKEGLPEDRVELFVSWLICGANPRNTKKSETPQLAAEGFTEGATNGTFTPGS